MRRMAEFLSRRITFRARLPQRFGRRPIFVSPANQLSIWKPGDAKFQKYLLDFAERFVLPGDIVWDIGANMGMFGVPAATRAKFTLAIEPDPFNQLLLHRTRAANPELALDVLPVAVSNAIGTASFVIPERGRSANALADAALSTQMGGERQLFTVITVTADWIMDRYPAPDFVKIDAEGAEAMILEGATRLLSEARPAFIIETAADHIENCTQILTRNNYRLFDSALPVDASQAVPTIEGIWDVLAIPAEKVERYHGK